MPRVVSSRIVEKILLKHAFRLISQKGSHAKFVAGTRIVIVPMAKRDISIGTLKSISRQAGIPVAVFQQKGK